MTVLDRLEQGCSNTLSKLAIRHSTIRQPLIEEVRQQVTDGHAVVVDIAIGLRTDPSNKLSKQVICSSTTARVERATVMGNPHFGKGVVGAPLRHLLSVLTANDAVNMTGYEVGGKKKG